MRRGSIAIAEVECDGCHGIIQHSERYLTINEEDGVEVEEGKLMRYCVECALQKGYAYYKEEKGERTLTFFPRL